MHIKHVEYVVAGTALLAVFILFFLLGSGGERFLSSALQEGGDLVVEGQVLEQRGTVIRVLSPVSLYAPDLNVSVGDTIRALAEPFDERCAMFGVSAVEVRVEE